MTHEEVCDVLTELYPKLKDVTGGWLFYRAGGGWGSRKLFVIAPANCGYTGRIVKSARAKDNSVIYVAPLQEELDTSPLPPTSEAFQNMPKAICKKCNLPYPLQVHPDHIKSCSIAVVDNHEAEPENNEQACCPICQEQMARNVLEIHASVCGERTFDDIAENITEVSCVDNDWKMHPDPKVAVALYTQEILRLHETGKPLLMCMDLRSGVEMQERDIIGFYKQQNVDWACPFRCQLEGDTAIGDGVTRHFFSTVLHKLKYGFNLNLGNTGVTCLFKGQPDHLVPSSSHFLIESDLFLVAGRMLGHSFLHGGPCLAGLSRAFVHVLFGGSHDTATILLEDCPDIDLRETINLLKGSDTLDENQRNKVLELCLSWDFPGPTEENRRWLYERLLSHAVLRRRTRQMKQIRQGLKETLLWPLLTQRNDVMFFPVESEDVCSAEMLLSQISWPAADDVEEYPAETTQCIIGYLKQFINTASSKERKDLLKFWVGWEIVKENLSVEVVRGDFPRSSTCFCILRLPGHYKDYHSFKMDLIMCIGTCKYGFGLV